MEWNEVMEQHGESMGIEGVNDQFTALQTSLGGLGIDILLNNREAQEFVPGSRLSKVVGEREQLKTSLTTAQTQLEEMKKAAKGDPAVLKQIEVLETANTDLLSQLETTRINGSLEKAFGTGLAENVSPEDVLLFVNKDGIKVQEDGTIVGAKEERERLEKEKPYLFGKVNNKGGSDKSGGGGGGTTYTMNDIIRGGFGK